MPLPDSEGTHDCCPQDKVTDLCHAQKYEKVSWSVSLGCIWWPPRWLTTLLAQWLRHPPQEWKILGSNPACTRIFPLRSHTSDLKIGTPVATLPGPWRYMVSAGTGWPSVSILWLGEMESLICNFYLSVAAHKIQQIRPLDIIKCCWDVKQPTDKTLLAKWLVVLVSRTYRDLLLCSPAISLGFTIFLLLRSPAISLGFTILGKSFAYMAIFQSNHWGSSISSPWMVYAGCVFVVSIHLSRTWLSGSMECMRAQTRPRFMLSSKRVLGEWSQNPC